MMIPFAAELDRKLKRNPAFLSAYPRTILFTLSSARRAWSLLAPPPDFVIPVDLVNSPVNHINESNKIGASTRRFSSKPKEAKWLSNAFNNVLRNPVIK